MPYMPTSQEWLTQSAMLLEARPTTTRITTKYNIKAANRRKTKKDGTPADASTTPTTKPPRATLILKTFDPHSGVCLKYKTTKAAEVSRLVQMLGSLGRKTAALPDLPAPAVAVEEEVATPGETGTATPPVLGAGAGAGAAGKLGQQAVGAAGAAGAAGGGGGKGKKKKGKR